MNAEKPLLQLALDYIALPPAMAMALLVRDAVDVIEIGTPLCKAEGMRAVSAVRALCPGNLLLADLKTPDVGALEAQMAYDAGADWMTLIGCAPLITVREAVGEAQRRGGRHDALVELTGLRDIAERAGEWREAGVGRVVYHRGWDEGNLTGRLWGDDDFETIRRLAEMGFRVSVAGNLTLDTLPRFAGVPISVFVVGRAIRETDDPPATAQRFREAIDRLGAG